MNRPWEKVYPSGLRADHPIEVTTIPVLLRRAVAAFGPRNAIEFRDRIVTYDELGAQAERFGATLLARGIGTVALYLPNTPYHPFAFFGGALAGARLTHLSPLDAERELAHKLRDSGARTLVTTNLAGLLPMAIRLLDAGLVDLVVVGQDDDWGAGPPLAPIPDRPDVVTHAAFVADTPLPAAWPEVSPDDVALLQYTGGTTGLPKGAMLRHGNLTAGVNIYDAWFSAINPPATGPGKMICVLPLFHIYALITILLRQVQNGNEIMLRQRFDVEATLDDIEKRRATAFPGVPTMWIALANHPGLETRDFSSLLYCSSGGAPLPVEVANRFLRLTGHRLGGGWGMTETCSAGTNLPREGVIKSGSIGVPLPGLVIEVVALDDPARVLGPNETGELRIKGPNITRGYWQRPEDNETAFVDGWLLTGDIGYMDDDGWFFIVDRKKDMIISGGFNVYPQVIEQAIYEHPGVEEVLVVGIPDAYRGEAAKAFVRLRRGTEAFTLDELKAFLADKVGRHEMPAALEFRDALPRTPVGKLSKVELRAEERQRPQH